MPNIEAMTPEQVISLTRNPNMQALLDAAIDTWQATSGLNDREMLRACHFILRNIAITLPWDETSGLDAQRFNRPLQTLFPSWRQCIGAAIGLDITRPEVTPQPTTAAQPAADEQSDVGESVGERQ